MSPATPRRAMALFALFVLVWVLLEEEVGALLQQPYSLVQVVWWRYAVHLLLLLAIFGWRVGQEGPPRPWQTKRRRFQLARSLCMLVMPLSFMAALNEGAPANAVWALFWISPLLVLLLAGRWLPESMRGAPAHLTWLCTGCTLAGAAMLWPQVLPFAAPRPGLWLLAAAAMALSFAIYVVMTRSLRDERPRTNLFYTAIVPFAGLTPFVPSTWITPSLHDAAVLCSIGALGLVALWALDRAASAAPLQQSTPALYAYLPLLAAIDWWVQGEAHTPREAVAAAAICAALAHLWWRTRSEAPRWPAAADSGAASR